MPTDLQADCEHVLAHTRELWDELRHQRIFITGGTGFLGCWLLESFIWANERLGLGASVVVLSRNPDAFRRKAPHLACHDSVSILCGDVTTFPFPEGEFGYVIHAAAEADTASNRMHPAETLETMIMGTNRVTQFAAQTNVRSLLLVSSGAVYGPQPSDLVRMDEDYRSAPDPLDVASAYGEGKRVAELLSVVGSARSHLEVKIARGFAFIGPYLPLNGCFAAGNFVRDAMCGGPIVVKGDGTARRSYMYGADLAIWLWTMLIKGRRGRAYNVGSEYDVGMRELADIIARECGTQCAVKVMQEARIPGAGMRYVPSTRRAHDELGLTEFVSLRDAVRRTLAYTKLRQ